MGGMAFDEGLAARLHELLENRRGITEKKMFGGVAFMSRGYVFVDPPGYESDGDLARWLHDCLAFVDSLPAKDA